MHARRLWRGLVQPGHLARCAGVLRLLGAGALVSLVSACATPPADPGPPWTSGRLALRVDALADRPAQSLSVAFEMRGSGDRGELRLNAPLGARLAEASWAPGEVRLVTSQGETRFASLEDLSTQALGEALPLQALPHWLAGHPWPGAAFEPLPAPAQGFTQLGWTIDLARLADRLVLARREAPPAVQLRVRLDAPD